MLDRITTFSTTAFPPGISCKCDRSDGDETHFASYSDSKRKNDRIWLSEEERGILDRVAPLFVSLIETENLVHT